MSLLEIIKRADSAYAYAFKRAADSGAPTNVCEDRAERVARMYIDREIARSVNVAFAAAAYTVRVIYPNMTIAEIV